MAHAQTQYPQTQGIRGKYTIHDIGCFITGFANLLTYRFGQNVDPLTINNILRDTDRYIDVDDGIRDDVGWQHVSYINGNIVVSKIGKGWPSSRNAILKFNYQSPRTRQFVTHFCLVEDPAAKTIVDSWDGKVKQNPYGEPLEYAEYVNVAQSVTPAQPPTPQPVTPPVQVDYSGKQLFLPAAAGTWRVYKESGPYYVGKEIGKLQPGHPSFAPGLTYDILGNPQRYVYLIQTEAFGRVAIYAGPDTIAEFRDRPAPAPQPAPAAPKPANIQYSRLETPLNLVTKHNPTKWWDLGFDEYKNARPAAELPAATPFRAFGKAQRTDLDKPVYYMTEEDFGNADQDGTPNNNNGINTVDLAFPPEPTPAPVVPQPEPEAVNESTDEEKIPVNVVHNDWKLSFKVNSAGEYTANTSTKVYDLNNPEAEPQQLVRGQTVKVAGMFTKDGINYYRTKKSEANNVWYGIPEISLQEESLEADGDIWDLDITESAAEELNHGRKKVIKTAAKIDGKVQRFINKILSLFKRKKQK